MAERRHISNETAQESQQAFEGKGAFDRIRIAREKLQSAKGALRDALIILAS